LERLVHESGPPPLQNLPHSRVDNSLKKKIKGGKTDRASVLGKGLLAGLLHVGLGLPFEV